MVRLRSILSLTIRLWLFFALVFSPPFWIPNSYARQEGGLWFIATWLGGLSLLTAVVVALIVEFFGKEPLATDER